jgi:ribonuclease HII
MKIDDPARTGSTARRRGRSFSAPASPGGRAALAPWHRERIDPDLAEEGWLHRAGYRAVAGVDEVGRGCLAGPVVAAAVILPDGWIPDGARDSKLLTAKDRDRIAADVRRHAVAWAIGVVEPGLIDRMNILQATILASQLAVARLAVRPDALLLDSLEIAGLSVRQRALVDADRLCASVSAASIVAKVARDRMMDAYDERFPGYGFARNRGYAAPEHRAAIMGLGPTPIHRRTFITAYTGGGAGVVAVDGDDGPDPRMIGE